MTKLLCTASTCTRLWKLCVSKTFTALHKDKDVHDSSHAMVVYLDEDPGVIEQDIVEQQLTDTA